MKKTQLAGTIVVGVDGTEAGTGAIRYAVEEAARRGQTRIRLLHVVHEPMPTTPMLPLVSSETMAEVGRRVITDAVWQVEEAGGTQLRVDRVVEHGSPARELLRASEGASLIVLGRRHRGPVEALLNASTATPVAARAHCPVISVPAGWAPTTHRCIVVGVDGSSGSDQALGVAFAEAARSDAALTVLHAWMLPDPYADLIASRVAVDDWKAQTEEHLAPMLHKWRQAFPTVHADLDVRYQPATAALVDVSARADLLVLGRHGHGITAGMALGSIPRALLRRAHCPVQIAPAVGAAAPRTETRQATASATG